MFKHVAGANFYITCVLVFSLSLSSFWGPTVYITYVCVGGRLCITFSLVLPRVEACAWGQLLYNICSCFDLVLELVLGAHSIYNLRLLWGPILYNISLVLTRA